MAKMVMEPIVRYKCTECGYITFIRPRKLECPMCGFGKDLLEDVRPEDNPDIS